MIEMLSSYSEGPPLCRQWYTYCAHFALQFQAPRDLVFDIHSMSHRKMESDLTMVERTLDFLK